MVADVSGKGVGSALLASLLQGALITATDVPQALARRMDRLNRFLLDRTGGEKYATVFYSLLDDSGDAQLRQRGALPAAGRPRRRTDATTLEATGLPVGLLEAADFDARRVPASSPATSWSSIATASPKRRTPPASSSGRSACAQSIAAAAGGPAAQCTTPSRRRSTAFTEGPPQSDDITLLVLEYSRSGQFVSARG